jgi:hypothetical protein
LEVRSREDVADTIRAARNSQADALNVFSSPVLSSLYREIIAFAAEYRLPAIYQWKEHAEAGGLVSRTESCGDVAAVRNHGGQGPQGRKTCRHAGRATHEV